MLAAQHITLASYIYWTDWANRVINVLMRLEERTHEFSAMFTGTGSERPRLFRYAYLEYFSTYS